MKQISEISKADIGKKFLISAQITSIRQSSGPTIFNLKDNSGLIKATGFIRAGERAFPNIVLGDNIQAEVIAKNRNDTIELEIRKYSKIQPINKFLIKSENLEKLREAFVKTADIIKQTISENRPIIIRHHDDTDGYAAGLVLEMTINERIIRLSSRTPFYDYIDALRDLNSHLISKKRYNQKAPLIILCDLGSNNQSIKSIKRLMLYEIDFIIIDHHKYDKENLIVKSFLNPHIFEMDSNLNAGILATELALLLNPSLNIKHLPALSAVADKSQGNDVEQYIKISGHDKDFLEKWSQVINHETFHMKFSESTELLEDLFFPGDKCNKIISNIIPQIENELKSIKTAAKKYVQIKEYKKFKLLRINKADIGYFGHYGSSKLIGVTHDLISGPRITIADTHDSMSFRADSINFSLTELLSELRKMLPYALIGGGGHDHAGNIKFNAISKNKVNDIISKYLTKIDS